MSNRRRGGSLVGPVILIGLGIVFLLNNLGILAWSAWEVALHLWPVLLIAAGLDLIIGRRSAWGAVVGAVLVLAVSAGALWLFGADVELGQRVPGEEIRQALGGTTRAEIVIARGNGVLRIEALPESDSLIEGTVNQGRGERVTRDFAVKGRLATFTLRSEGPTWGPFIGDRGSDRTWNLGLSPDVPLHLNVDLGVGESNVDLSNLMMDDLEVSLGIGRVSVTLPDEGRFRAKVDSAIGETIVVIPDGLAARIHFSTGLASRNLPAGYQAHDDVYTSSGYESADDRVDLEVRQAIGNITIRHARTR